MQTCRNLIPTLLLVSVLCACTSNVRHTIGLERQVPDAFKVVSNPPLTVPPDFHLVPPQLGAPNVGQDIPNQAQASILKSTSHASTTISPADRILLGRAKTNEADPSIVTILNTDEQDKMRREQEKNIWQRVVDKIALKEKADPTVNASKEKQRIAKNQQEGKPITEGKTPEVDSSYSGGFLNRILGL